MTKMTSPFYECFDARDTALTKMVLKNTGIKFTEVDGTHLQKDNSSVKFYVQQLDPTMPERKEKLLGEIYFDDDGEMNDKVGRQFNLECRHYSTKFRKE